MEFFLDTADIDDILFYKEMNLVDGVTTNPAILSKGKDDPITQIKRIAEIVSGPISIEVTKEIPEEMIGQAERLADLAENVLIKLPADRKGYLAAEALKKKGIKVNVTLIFHPTQALPFIRLGCEYISLFIGRVEDFGLSNMKMVGETRQTIDRLGSTSKVLAASMRHPEYILEAINQGADALTVPPSAWEKVYSNPMFTMAEGEFMDSWRSLPENIRSEYEKF